MYVYIYIYVCVRVLFFSIRLFCLSQTYKFIKQKGSLVLAHKNNELNINIPLRLNITVVIKLSLFNDLQYIVGTQEA